LLSVLASREGGASPTVSAIGAGLGDGLGDVAIDLVLTERRALFVHAAQHIVKRCCRAEIRWSAFTQASVNHRVDRLTN